MAEVIITAVEEERRLCERRLTGGRMKQEPDVDDVIY